MVTLLILVAAIALLVWGFNRARPDGKLGIYAWLQSVVLTVPWLLFFGLFSFGIYLNLAGVLFLIVSSAVLYIYLGRRLRELSRAEAAAQQTVTAVAAKETQVITSDSGLATESPTQPAPAPAGDAAPEPEGTDEDEPDAPVIPLEDLAILEGIFGVDTFFRTETVPYDQGAIFRGNLRGDPEASIERLSSLAQERLGDAYRLFLLRDPKDKPVVVALPKSADLQPLSPARKAFAIVLGVATFLTCLEASGILLGFDLLTTSEKWPAALPYALGTVAVLAAHEAGHWVVAQQRGAKISWPFFLPTWNIGSFGALTRIESILPNRSVLFDIAFAGPAAGGLLSFAMLFLGLVLSHPGSRFQLPVEFFRGSALVGALAKVVLGSALLEPIVDIHPLTIVGWLGLVITALNLLPAGQLDGGRIVQSIYGRKIAGRATVITLIILVLASLANPLALYWAALILLLQRNLERPTRNELEEPDDARAALGLLALFLTLATLLPLTPTLAGKLGIG